MLSLNRQSGFTLMEMMVTVGIAAVMAAVAVPSYLSYMPKSRLNGAALVVVGDLNAARMKAVKLNRKVKVHFYDNHTYKIYDDADGNDEVANGEGDVEVKNIQSSYSDVTFGSCGSPVYSPRGTASVATITLQNASGPKKITVAITGRAKIN